MIDWRSASFDAIRRFRPPAGKSPCRVGIVVPMFMEQRRISPPGPGNPFGEDAWRAKINHVLEISGLNKSLRWDLLAVEDGEEAVHGRPTTSDIAADILQTMSHGRLADGVWVSDGDGLVRAHILRFPAAEKRRLRGCKGTAVVWGLHHLLEAGADYCVYTDADLSADLRHLGLLMAPLADGKRVVIGSRLHRLSTVKNRPLFGRLSSRLYSGLANALLPLAGARDIQSGFKLYDSGLLREILPALQPAPGPWQVDERFDFGASFDSNFLARAVLKAGPGAVQEVPIEWIDSRPESKFRGMQFGIAAVRMIKGLFCQRRFV
ncbi:MAG TPA: hypothetical protein VMU17_07985 [Elusimicrobiota bacterium]|nr:hypothetical protein [Elusimicrobiota bacterium]